MRVRERLDRLSVKWKLFGWLALFSALLLVLLWLFQIVFLDSFYKTIKTESLKSSGEMVVKNIESESLSQLLDRIAVQNNVSIRISDEWGNVLIQESVDSRDQFMGLSQWEMISLYQRAVENGGMLFEQFSKESFSFAQQDAPPLIGRFPARTEFMMESMIYVRTIELSDKTPVMVMLHSVITPVNSTVETLRVQFVYIALIMVILSLALAFLISRRISKPIVQINDTAKVLARGDYNVHFTGKGYLEISELNNTLNFAAVELSKVESLRRELIANISHDLRTPLTMITGYAEVMRDLPGENTPENVQIIIDEAKRLSTLVTDILDLSQLQSGVKKMNPTVYNLTQDIRDIIARYSKLMEQKGYQISFISGESVYVKADQVKISQVIYNLINNAINYTGPDKRVTVCQSIHGNRVKIEIIDTGEGIPPEKLPYIWDRYYKVDKLHRRSTMGTGLGLSIVREVLELHHAEYSVISTVGQGSIFSFELERLEMQEVIE